MVFPKWPIVGIGRRPQKLSKVPFKEEWPMKLDTQVSTRGGKSSDAPCLKETFAFLTCLKDNGNSHELCRAEGEAVTHCQNRYLKNKKEIKQKAKMAEDFMPGISAKDMGPKQLNRFLSHFPHKLKKN